MNKNEYKLYSELERDHWWFRARREILKDVLSKVEKKNEKCEKYSVVFIFRLWWKYRFSSDRILVFSIKIEWKWLIIRLKDITWYIKIDNNI